MRMSTGSFKAKVVAAEWLLRSGLSKNLMLMSTGFLGTSAEQKLLPGTLSASESVNTSPATFLLSRNFLLLPGPFSAI